MVCSTFFFALPSLRSPFVLLLSSASCLIVDKVDAQSDSVQTAQIKELKRLRCGTVIHRQLWWLFFVPAPPCNLQRHRAIACCCSALPARLPGSDFGRERKGKLKIMPGTRPGITWIKRQRCERIQCIQTHQQSSNLKKGRGQKLTKTIKIASLKQVPLLCMQHMMKMHIEILWTVLRCLSRNESSQAEKEIA